MLTTVCQPTDVQWQAASAGTRRNRFSFTLPVMYASIRFQGIGRSLRRVYTREFGLDESFGRTPSGSQTLNDKLFVGSVGTDTSGLKVAATAWPAVRRIAVISNLMARPSHGRTA
jgi:hypothetical protein